MRNLPQIQLSTQAGILFQQGDAESHHRQADGGRKPADSTTDDDDVFAHTASPANSALT